MKVLFICNQNKHCSKTAELLFKNLFETKSAGLFNERPLTDEEIEWADLVVVMEDFQRTEIGRRFPKQYNKKKVVSLGIDDTYSFNQPELINILKLKVEELFSPL
ncbi:phosphotyrosine protein phosphatase [Candidatus Woesearchaeota archaeon]|nr:phosphotyrosine protein phosphatase [Candidatus Woesearchaeota archaeon]